MGIQSERPTYLQFAEDDLFELDYGSMFEA
jgi:hypothetical protein